MKVERFEDMKVWQEAREITRLIYSLTSRDKFKRDFGLRDQIQRASVSIMSNIAEGFERQSDKEFITFLFYAKGSAGEVRSLLYVALDMAYITQDEFNCTYEKVLSITKQLANFIKYLKHSKENQKIEKSKD